MEIPDDIIWQIAEDTINLNVHNVLNVIFEMALQSGDFERSQKVLYGFMTLNSSGKGAFIQGSAWVPLTITMNSDEYEPYLEVCIKTFNGNIHRHIVRVNSGD